MSKAKTPKKKSKAKKVFLIILLALIASCAFDVCRIKNGAKQIPHRFAEKAEAGEMIRGNTTFYGNFTQNDIDYRMQKTGASLGELVEAASNEVYDFNVVEKLYVENLLVKMKRKLDKNGYELPPLEEIVFAKTDMSMEGAATGYTSGTNIYLATPFLTQFIALGLSPEMSEAGEYLLWHELFHCLTRNNPDFRKQMYSVIDFTIADKDYEIPPSVKEYMITNPDVEHHDSYASFVIDGKPTDCFTVYVTPKKFEEAQTRFFDCGITALVPVDGTDTYYTKEQAANFDDLFGLNTGYVIDPEECMADNFAYAMQYGIVGKNGQGYATPGIIQGVIDVMKK